MYLSTYFFIMHLERRRCPSDPYVWSCLEVALHCRALIDLLMNSWLWLITCVDQWRWHRSDACAELEFF
jgi:hypothetical protein